MLFIGLYYFIFYFDDFDFDDFDYNIKIIIIIFSR